jgi:hypothetical protein
LQAQKLKNSAMSTGTLFQAQVRNTAKTRRKHRFDIPRGQMLSARQCFNTENEFWEKLFEGKSTLPNPF